MQKDNKSKLNLNILSSLPTLFTIDCGNPNTIIEVIGNDHKDEDKYVKKITLLKQNNLQYAYKQRTLMQIIKSQNVIKLIHWEEILQKKVQKLKIKDTENDIVSVPKNLILYMEYCENGDLRNYLIKFKPPIQKRVQFFLDILHAMRFLHQKFIIHRDMKLQNIFVTKDHKIKIADLGFASQTITLAQTQVGTFGQQAPQVFADSEEDGYNEKVDVWSIGYLGFQILNQPFQFQLNQQKFIRDPFLPKERLRSKVNQFGNQNIKQNYFKIFQQNYLFFNQQVPNCLKHLLSHMLKPNPKNRISFAQIYKNECLSKLKQQIGIQKAQKMINLKQLTQDYKDIYKKIQRRKIDFLKKQELYAQLYDGVYEPLLAIIYPNQRLISIQNDQMAIKAMILLHLTMRKMKLIYKQISEMSLISVKKKLQDFDRNVSKNFVTIRNNLESYLKSQYKQSLDQNSPLLSTQYFRNILAEVSLKYNLKVDEIVLSLAQ